MKTASASGPPVLIPHSRDPSTPPALRLYPRERAILRMQWLHRRN
jgi:hypothetical protein